MKNILENILFAIALLIFALSPIIVIIVKVLWELKEVL